MPQKDTLIHQNGVIKTSFIVLTSLGMLLAGGLLLWTTTFEIPDLNTFDERKVDQSTKIYDRTGEVLLYDIHQDIQRTIVPFEEISREIKNATVAIEDAAFYNHHGIRPTAIARAILVNIGAGSYSQGGSTITQQVVKNSILTSEKKISRKIKEWFLSLKLERVASKEEILELYLNEAPYGGSIYGIEEASRVFFDKTATELELAEAAYLAAIPQAPTYYSPYGNNLEALEERKNLVLTRMLDLGFITAEQYEEARNEEVVFQPPSQTGIKAPHFVFYVREQLENTYGKERIEQGGLRVITTLDWDLQEQGEQIVAEETKDHQERFNANNAGLVAIDPKTGEIVTMVGSRDYFNEEIDGNFNVTINPNRQPGSAFKPFVYATAFMKGYTPDTVVFDLATQFDLNCKTDFEGKPLDPEEPLDLIAYAEEEDNPCYIPENYDGVYRGPMTLRDALAQSVNVPAIKTLYLAGIRDSITVAGRIGITSLSTPQQYGLTLVLGGGETSLLEMTNAYGVFANEGVRNDHTAILRVETTEGEVLENVSPSPRRVIDQQIALQISDVLSDNEARTPAFGSRSHLYFEDIDVAAKTGTTNDYRDAWIVGYTPTIAVGAWVGNTDNSPMEKKVAGFIVAPMWNAFMREAIGARPPETFREPEMIDDYDTYKPIIRGEWKGGLSYMIDTLSGKLATEYTPDETKKEVVITDVHSILYWVDKNNPHGPQPDDPLRDSQFELWETPVAAWVERAGIVPQATSTIPSEYDDIHRPEFFPTLTINHIDENAIYARDARLSLSVSAIGKFPLTKVDLYINNVYIGSSHSDPFLFAFEPRDIDGIGNVNTIKVIGTDLVKNKSEATVLLHLEP